MPGFVTFIFLLALFGGAVAVADPLVHCNAYSSECNCLNKLTGSSSVVAALFMLSSSISARPNPQIGKYHCDSVALPNCICTDPATGQAIEATIGRACTAAVIAEYPGYNCTTYTPPSCFS
ncbi:hypothetical protein SISNIDRAFT_483963 [Sistotremastrum niveocremeum HHB9708]|uniref:Extracellular membrane protein CFEM domain-containing protein n=1 Tax=Sistotremastrum niveocremeum HHB9708 TaxID=1314777 RepID=A0A164WIE0_9AGAM|nr:hypothetical protein SISNIDRAFT_483963 [Sistotremastrum niveocremeum HHB9708]